ncbi:hypothetical protein EB809_03450 [Marinobacter sp. R17]|uniref:hypothetical protein n=1 Tax=Marinobacter TaxID=2742 RepID=UPI000F4B2B86|nr:MULTISPECIES: hypothetical protein [Marinobacter]ROU01527.1 hypothetical protein EB809_03450 [Marinobacter sp. R17]
MVYPGKWFRASVMALFACVIPFFSIAASAAENPLLAAFHQFRISNFAALNAYYRFSVNGDTDTLNEIVAAINESNSQIKQVDASAGDILKDDQIESLNTEFDKYKHLMRQNINDVRKNGYPDLRLVSDMANQAQALSSKSAELYDIVRTNNNVKADERVEAARAAAVLMAQMMSKYSARSTSSVSQTFQGADTEQPLDEQAHQFDEQMSKVTEGHPSGELRAALSSVASKWAFIRGSYINYNDNNVSFVIDRYSKEILRQLAEAIAMMTGTPVPEQATAQAPNS